MFFEVRVYDAKGELKRVVSSKKLSKQYWKKNSNAPVDYYDTDYGNEDWSSNLNLDQGALRVEESWD